MERVRALFEHVSWPCEIYRNYAEQNMGCDYRVPSGIDWVFEQVEQAIILEDDCIPCLQFFEYAEQMLNRYDNDESVMMISGCNHLQKYQTDNSCFFTARVYTWGWATWRRAWKYYCDDATEWERIQSDGTLKKIYPARTRYYLKKEFNYYFERGKCPWDYLWWISCMGKGGLCAVPKVNLITNEGFGEDATHTQDKGDYKGETFYMEFPLKYPEQVRRDYNFDKYDRGLNPPGLLVRAIKKLKRMIWK